MPHPPMRALIVVFALIVPLSGFSQEVFINELHYDNAGGDSGEFVEIAGPAGTSLGGYSLVFYNGSSGAAYMTTALFGVIPSEAGSGFGAVAFPVSGIQNGAPDAVALIDEGIVVQFLSYEGSFTAAGGVANGMASEDIGVAESDTTLIGQSLQLSGTGADFSEFVWGGPTTASPGEVNAAQVFVGTGVPSIALSVVPSRFFEAAGAAAATGTISLSPAPLGTVDVALVADVAGQIVLPASVEVGPSGVATFMLGAEADGVGDGIHVVGLSASDPTGEYIAGMASVTVFDSDPPEGRGVALRVAAYNVRNGVGSPGSAQYEAALAVLRRVGADFIAFSEVNAGGGFANLVSLLADLGMATDAAHLATAGDAFVGVPFESGDFGSGAQSLAFASRWPITEVVQIERGAFGRTEVARYPLFVRVDVPGLANDPAFVAVHLKAGNLDADNFRRLVEAWRINQFLAARGLSGTADNVFLLGDFNEDNEAPAPTSYSTSIDPAFHVFADGSTFPGSYLLGADLAPPNGRDIGYVGFPETAFSEAGFAIVDAFQVDGARRTFNLGGNARIDYILAGTATLSNAPPESEVFNSLLEIGYDGLPKLGPVPAGMASLVGSDHHLVFGDFALEPAPRIVLDIFPAAIGGDAPGTATGTLTILPTPAGAVEVELLVDASRLAVPGFVQIPSGEGVATFPISLVLPGGVGADALLRVTAHAPGHVSGHGYVATGGASSSGEVIFSQYVEAASGASPRAVEVLNNSGGDIDFATTPLRLSVGNDGTAPVVVLTVLAGNLADGEVFVIGGVDVGDYLVSEGLLDDPPMDFVDYDDGTLFLDGSGRLVFVKMALPFNGDDSLQLRVAFVLADTFGRPGSDPGTAWVGQGVSTANQNIGLRDDVATPSSGFDDPAGRFVTIVDGVLSGFGLAPARADPYAVWASGFGLFGIAAAPVQDPESDGRNHLLEYALGSHPTQPDHGSGLVAGVVEFAGEFYLTVTHRRLSDPGRVSYEIEGSFDGASWVSLPTEIDGALVPEGEGIESVTRRLVVPISAASTQLLRLRVALP